MLTPAWTPLRYHPVQWAFFNSTKRFNIAPCGRRSGKSEIAKRRTIVGALECERTDGRALFTAPVYTQAKLIFWDHLKALIPPNMIRKTKETDLTIRLFNNYVIQVAGLDKPERIEGSPWDKVVVDEFANCKQDAWGKTLSPLLDTEGRLGIIDIIGVPRGAPHYRNLWDFAKTSEDWGCFFWTSVDIIPDIAERAKERMDIKSWRREYMASWESYEGKAYYAWDKEESTKYEVQYKFTSPLLFAFDFNVSPGTASVWQKDGDLLLGLDEVWIESDSTTAEVVKELHRKFGHHQGEIHLFGDASGGAKKSSGVQGSDWDIIRAYMKELFPTNVIRYRVPKANPAVRSRLNSVNARLKDAQGKVRVYVDKKCKHLIKDFDSVARDKQGNIVKPKDTELTHLSDGVGYLIWKLWPCYNNEVVQKSY